MMHDDDIPALRAEPVSNADDDAFLHAVQTRVTSVRFKRRAIGAGVAAVALLAAWTLPDARSSLPSDASVVVAASYDAQHDATSGGPANQHGVDGDPLDVDEDRPDDGAFDDGALDDGALDDGAFDDGAFDDDSEDLPGIGLLAGLDDLDASTLLALDDPRGGHDDGRDDVDPSFAWGDLDGSSAQELGDVAASLDRALAGRAL